MHRAELRKLGIGPNDIRNEVMAGRWRTHGRVTVQVSETSSRARLWWAIWETGAHARLDGATALIEAGLTGWATPAIEVVVPHGATVRRLPGVKIRSSRNLEPATGIGLPVSDPAPALLRGIRGLSVRAAATLIAMSVQQRIVAAETLASQWEALPTSIRRRALEQIVADVCDGAHSLGELDFARMCRARGLPEPTRQALRRGPNGRIYLDVRWSCGLVVEIDGVHHGEGLQPVADALRANGVTLSSEVVLRIPVLGLRLSPDEFMAQVAQGLRQRGGLAA